MLYAIRIGGEKEKELEKLFIFALLLLESEGNCSEEREGEGGRRGRIYIHPRSNGNDFISAYLAAVPSLLRFNRYLSLLAISLDTAKAAQQQHLANRRAKKKIEKKKDNPVFFFVGDCQEEVKKRRHFLFYLFGWTGGYVFAGLVLVI